MVGVVGWCQCGPWRVWFWVQVGFGVWGGPKPQRVWVWGLGWPTKSANDHGPLQLEVHRNPQEGFDWNGAMLSLSESSERRGVMRENVATLTRIGQRRAAAQLQHCGHNGHPVQPGSAGWGLTTWSTNLV